MGLYGGIAMECLPAYQDLQEKFEGEDVFILLTAKNYVRIITNYGTSSRKKTSCYNN